MSSVGLGVSVMPSSGTELLHGDRHYTGPEAPHFVVTNAGFVRSVLPLLESSILGLLLPGPLLWLGRTVLTWQLPSADQTQLMAAAAGAAGPLSGFLCAVP